MAMAKQLNQVGKIQACLAVFCGDRSAFRASAGFLQVWEWLNNSWESFINFWERLFAPWESCFRFWESHFTLWESSFIFWERLFNFQ
jgi:hypothetical protein